jgi:hypothetical protein
MLQRPGENIYVGTNLKEIKGLIFSAIKYSSKLLSGIATEVIRQKRASPPLKQVNRLQTNGSRPWTGALL